MHRGVASPGDALLPSQQMGRRKKPTFLSKKYSQRNEADECPAVPPGDVPKSQLQGLGPRQACTFSRGLGEVGRGVGVKGREVMNPQHNTDKQPSFCSLQTCS